VPSVFINYRRADSGPSVGRLTDDLKEQLPGVRVFRDVTEIHPGEDFRAAIEQELADTKVVLAVIGRSWLTLTAKDGKRRLDDPADLVAVELAAALKAKICVIPVLVDGAQMPDAAELPEPIRHLAARQALEITDTRWQYDIQQLVKVVHRVLGDERKAARNWIKSALVLSVPVVVVVTLVAVLMPPQPGDTSPKQSREAVIEEPRPRNFVGHIANIYDRLDDPEKKRLGKFVGEPYLYTGPQSATATTFTRFQNGVAVYFKFDPDTNPGSQGGRSFFIHASDNRHRWWLAKHYPRESSCWRRQRPATNKDRCKIVHDCWEPKSGIGSVWRCEAAIQASLGRPTTCETNFAIQIQEFQAGFLVINVPIFPSSVCSRDATIVQTESYVLFKNHQPVAGNIVMRGDAVQIRTSDVGVQTADRWPIWTCTDASYQLCSAF
jgi:hypothetical protein